MYQTTITFKDIKAWQKAYELTLKIYKVTPKYPKFELFALANQLRRASVSVVSNIAEGFKRKGFKDKLKFYNQAEASLEELKCQTMLSHDLGYLNQPEYLEIQRLENDTGKLLNGWIKSMHTT